MEAQGVVRKLRVEPVVARAGCVCRGVSPETLHFWEARSFLKSEEI